MADNRGGMAILPLSGANLESDTYFMALFFFLGLIVAIALASAAGWVSDSRTFSDWRVVRDGDSQPLPKL
jgi:hypothetical protein